MPRQKKQILKQRADGRYCCRYKGLQFMGRTSDEALAARDEYKRQERSLATTKGPMIADYAKIWLPQSHTSSSDQTYAEASCLLEKLLKRIGNKRFFEIKPSDIKAVYHAEFSGKSDSYIKSASQLYKAFFAAAVDDGYCAANPAKADSAKPHKGKPSKRHRAITPQEREYIETLCTDHRAHAVVMCMLYAGLRPQEAKALDIDRDVDFENDLITVSSSVHLSGSNGYIANDTLKTPQSRRQIPLFPPLKKALEHKHGLLVSSVDDKLVTIQAFRSVWESYVSCMETAINGCQERWYGRKKEHKGKKLPPFIRFTVRPYDLRYSFCTMCRDNGVELNTCIHWMGHKDAKMILQIYDEYSSERSKKEAEKLEKKLFRMQNDMQS